MATELPQITAPVQEPDLNTLLNQLRADLMYSLNCHQIGTIQSFDASKQTAEINLNVLRVVGTQLVNYPLLVDCPVFVHSGGSARVTMPVQSGDTCLVLFNDRNLDNWFSTGNTVAPNTRRAHDLSDGLALVGFRCLANKLTDYSTNSLDVHGGEYKLDVRNNDMALKTILQTIVTALTALNLFKVGPSVETYITPITTQTDALLK